MPPEQWRAIYGFPGYEVSDQGRVRSYYSRGANRRGGWSISETPRRILKPSRKSRYLHVSLTRGDYRHTRYIHQLVASAFLGECPEGMEVCHIDEDSHHNWSDNLCYGTHLANVQDAKANGAFEGRKKFPGGRVRTSISLPRNMLDALKQRRTQESIPVSTQILQALEAAAKVREEQ